MDSYEKNHQNNVDILDYSINSISDDVNKIVYLKDIFLSKKKTNKSNIKSKSFNDLSNNELYLLVFKIIEIFRKKGFIYADINPVYKFSENNILDNIDLGDIDSSSKIELNQINNFTTFNLSLNNIIEKLSFCYLSKISYDYSHILDEEKTNWIQSIVESEDYFNSVFSVNKKAEILKKLYQATQLENFLETKYLGKKRFSIEGSEILIASIDQIIKRAANKYKTKEINIGMPHRGRINSLVHNLNQKYEDLFDKFNDLDSNMGDAKYHLGASHYSSSLNLKINMMYNPSHLEVVGSILMGYTKASIDKESYSSDDILPILIHGDAAISGQGIVYECAQMSSLSAYSVYGTIHIIVNNQIGFTTLKANYMSSRNCSDIAKILQNSLIIHVNGQSAEDCIKAMELAIDYRMKFKTDVFININTFRKLGHNEMDEPRFTSPLLYKTIDQLQPIYSLYKDTSQLDSSIISEFTTRIDKDLDDAYKKSLEKLNLQKDKIILYSQSSSSVYANSLISITRIDNDIVQNIIPTLSSAPESFNIIKQIKFTFNKRLKLLKESKIDWATAELLAYATIITEFENTNVILHGQDVTRGTFSHRQSILYDQQTGDPYCPLHNLKLLKSKYIVVNSLLSELGVLGFQYGYSINDQKSLIIWEAQFGDFSNGAQVIMDQYISAAESKWGLNSSLVLLLPHGYEGQGSEHSDCRLDRVLQLCSNFNMIVVNITTPSNIFHVLRRSVLSKVSKPLVVASPKSLLRHSKAISNISSLTDADFLDIIDDSYCANNKSSVTTIVLCSGKIFYDLDAERIDKKLNNFAIIRIEQLYPLNTDALVSIVNQYKNYNKVIWAQEEPCNLGPHNYIKLNLLEIFSNLCFIARNSSSSVATGSYRRHMFEQNDIIQRVFSD